MIITHTQGADGQCRIYLGGKASMECWLAPKADGVGWSFHMADAVAGNPLSPDQQRQYCTHLLLQLADMLDVAADELRQVPFEAIAALHDVNPYESRRVAMPRRKTVENGFMATPPHIRRPTADFTSADFDKQRYRNR